MTRALGDFLLEPFVYRLGQFSPVSIRDQIVRATYLVDHLLTEGALAVNTHLVIVGAGAAGVTAAVAAASLGVRNVVLVESHDTVMALQANCPSRWLDPVQYDWPAAHWSDGLWPIKDPATPRSTAQTRSFAPIGAGIAEDLSIEMANRAEPHFKSGKIRGRFGWMVQTWSPTPTGIAIQLTDLAGRSLEIIHADLLILAAGFGNEQARVPNATGSDFEGLRFWSEDRFQQDDMGMVNVDPRVLVSGGGDGALQDFVRLTTGVSAVKDAMDAVWACSNETTSWKESMMGLWHWDEHARRALAFEPSPLDSCEILRRLHARHQEAVQDLTNSAEWPQLVAWFDRTTARRKLGSVHLALPCDHFHGCYGLNRTVALITIAYLNHKGLDPILPNTALLSTRALGHHPCTDGCWGQPHEARLATGVSCRTTTASLKVWNANDTVTLRVDGLVIRHGIDPLTIGSRTFERMTPQVVPMHLP